MRARSLVVASAVAALPLVYSAPARAGCNDPGSHCSDADKIQEQTTSEGNAQRAEWFANHRSAPAPDRVAPPVVEERPLCMRRAAWDDQCRALKAAATDRWKASGNGEALVSRLLRAGPEPRCFSSQSSGEARVRTWAAVCNLTTEQQQSLLGEKPAAVKKAEREAEAAKRAASAEKQRIAEARKAENTPEARAARARWQANVEVGRELSNALSDAKHNRGLLEVDKLSVEAEQAACVFGNANACGGWIKLSGEKHDLARAYLRSCRGTPQRAYCKEPGEKIGHFAFSETWTVTTVACDDGDADACVEVARWHLGLEVEKLARHDTANAAFGRGLALETCSMRKQKGCELLADAIEKGNGGASAPSPAEKSALEAACGSNPKMAGCATYGGSR